MNQVPADSRHAEFDPGIRKVRLHKKAGDEIASKHACLKAGLKFSYTNIFGLFGNRKPCEIVRKNYFCSYHSSLYSQRKVHAFLPHSSRIPLTRDECGRSTEAEWIWSECGRSAWTVSVFAMVLKASSCCNILRVKISDLFQEIDLLSTFLVVLAIAGSGLHRYVKKMHSQYGDYVDRANGHHKRAVLYKFGVPWNLRPNVVFTTSLPLPVCSFYQMRKHSACYIGPGRVFFVRIIYSLPYHFIPKSSYLALFLWSI